MDFLWVNAFMRQYRHRLPESELPMGVEKQKHNSACQEYLSGLRLRRRDFGCVTISGLFGAAMSGKSSWAGLASDSRGIDGKADIKLQRMSISPNGETVAFEYLHPNRGRSLGLWAWRSSTIKTIPSPSGGAMWDASFFANGEYLLAITAGRGVNHLVRVDLKTLRIAELAQMNTYWSAPVLQPGTDRVLFVASHPYHVIQLDLNTGKIEKILEKAAGFSHVIATPHFVGSDEIVFEAMGPLDAELREQMIKLKRDDFRSIGYRMSFGARPNIILPDPAGVVAAGAQISFISASGDGRTLAFISSSRSAPLNEDGQFNFELFTLSERSLEQKTDLRSHMAYASMSRDASAAVFGSKLHRRGARTEGHEFRVLDLRNGEITTNHLAELLREAPDFVFEK